MKALAASVLAGTLAISLPMMVLTIPMALTASFQAVSDPSWVATGLIIAVSPLILTLGFVLTGCAIFGVPVVLLLRRAERQSGLMLIGAGVACGFLWGFAIPLLNRAAEPLWVNVLGAWGGAWSGAYWWKHTRLSADDCASETRAVQISN